MEEIQIRTMAKRNNGAAITPFCVFFTISVSILPLTMLEISSRQGSKFFHGQS